MNPDNLTLLAIASVLAAGLTMAIGSIATSLAEGRAVSEALKAIAQQPDEAGPLTRTLFVGLAMIESIAIYCLVVALVLVFANPFWTFLTRAGGD